MRAKLARAIRHAFPVACLTGLIWLIDRGSSTLDWKMIFTSPASGAYFGLAICLCMLQSAGSFLMWYILVNSGERVIGLSDAYSLFAMSNLAKYLPAGAVFQLASYVHFADTPKVRGRSLVALLLGMAIGLQAGAIPALLEVREVLPRASTALLIALTLALLAFIALISRFGVLQIAVSRLGARFSSIQLPRSVPARVILWTNLISIAAWIGVGLASAGLLRIVAPSASWSTTLFIIPCYYVAIWMGYLAVFSPAGMGVVEGSLVFLLSRRIPASEAAFIALSLRTCTIIGDLLFSLPIVIAFPRSRGKDP